MLFIGPVDDWLIWQLISCKPPIADHHDYVCLGFFQQDDLEQKFGYFRMSAGCNFYLTAQDIFNAHYVDKTKLLLALTDTETIDYKESQHTCERCQVEPTVAVLQLIDDLNELTPSVAADEKLSIYYIAGYVTSKHEELRGRELEIVPPALTLFLDKVNRGELQHPSIPFYNILLLSYVFFNRTPSKLCRNRFVKIFRDFPAIFHLDIELCPMAAKRIANIFLKRFACKNTTTNQGQTKRKIAKLSSSLTK
ncbi:group XV phospholipase a2 [Plakobranchus ocellatus]|uniref:Group XV phospholipase a2 n=1 Tax=Plakobranchus ocellatus TaxID=259542 RepID=A0AAV3YTZ1_9GAST|nr:group XV phospholipase a2 [Plakobranchus ocellatus]